MFGTSAARITALSACAALALGIPAAVAATTSPQGTTLAVGQAYGGQIVEVLPLRILSVRNAAAELTDAGFDPTTLRYGVETYRLVYRTVDPHGRPTTASGLLALPRSSARRVHTVFFAHGSVVYRADAPSLTQDAFDSAAPIVYASAGFATVAPDYLGLGTGPGQHPWEDVPSETTASLDLLRAARSFVPAIGRELARDVLATGFSQGATAAIGLGRALQNGADAWFRLAALAPVSGAYYFQHIELPALLSGKLNPTWSVAYTAYFVVTWNRLHRFYDTPGQVFNNPRVAGLFDGLHTGRDILMGLPPTVDALLTPHGFDILRHPTPQLAAAMRVHDAVCTSWTPHVPVRLYLASGDDQVANANTTQCAAALKQSGADVKTVDVGNVDHLGSHRRATTAIVRWFIELGSPS
jgi:dienelactone hydrolase